MHDAANQPSPWVSLTLLVPAALRARVVDWLLAREDAQLEFSVHGVAAHGPLVRLSVDEEQVQGFADRVEVKLIVERPRLSALIEGIEALLAGAEGGYWVRPLERFAAFPPKTAQRDQER